MAGHVTDPDEVVLLGRLWAAEEERDRAWQIASGFEAERNLYREAIRRHRDYRGDDRCHLNDGKLYSVLPEGDTRPAGTRSLRPKAEEPGL